MRDTKSLFDTERAYFTMMVALQVVSLGYFGQTLVSSSVQKHTMPRNRATLILHLSQNNAFVRWIRFSS